MKILHVITSLRVGGAEMLMGSLLPQLKQKGYEVSLYVFLGIRTPISEQLEAAGITLIMGDATSSVYHPKHIYKLRKLLPQYDIIHTHNTAPQLFTAIANMRVHRPLVTTEHSTNNRRRHIYCFRKIDRWMYQQYQHVICISEICRKNLMDYLGYDIANVCVINNGIDTKHFMNATASAEYNHHTLGAQNIVINVAGFRWEKDQATIIRAMSRLPLSYHLLLVGDGESGRIAACRRLAQDLNVSDRVHFLGVRTDVPTLLKTADIVVMSSHFEGLSLSNLEGMAAGKPFVASDVDGLRDIVAGYGVLFPHEDDEALAQVIRQLCENTDYAATIATRCQKRAQEFDICRMVAGYDVIYHKIDQERCV